jgi:hypothetical protein
MGQKIAVSPISVNQDDIAPPLRRIERSTAARTMLARKMPKRLPDEHSQAALRSLIQRVIVFFVAGLAVIGAFVVAWQLGLFKPSGR